MASLDAVRKISNEITSSFKVPSSPKDVKLLAANPQPDAVVKCTDTGPTLAMGEQPTDDEPPVFPADYYRFGRKEKKVDPETGSEFTVITKQPRSIDEFNADPGIREDLASIRIVGKIRNQPKEVDLIPRFQKFFLQSVQESHQERHQIVETFGDFFVFFYGERPPIYNFTGIMLNSKDVNWIQDYMFFYENFLRGTKTVELNAKIIMTYQGRQIEGFILNTSNVTQAATQNGVSMSFQVVVTNRIGATVSEDFGVVEQDGTFRRVETLLQLLDDQGLSEESIDRAFQEAADVLSSAKPPASCEPQVSTDVNALGKDFGIPSFDDGSGLAKLDFSALV